MESNRIVSTGRLPAWAESRLEPDFRLEIADDPDPPTVAAMMGPDVVGLIARSSTPVDEDLIAKAENLRVIGRTGAGYDSIDVEAARRQGIVVLYTPDAMTQAAAEHAVALLLAACKELPGWQQRVRDSRWRERNSILNRDLHGATLGIVGYGRIGRKVHQLLRGWEVTVMACDPLVEDEQIRRLGARPSSLDQLLTESDFISLHAPLNESTRGMINADNLERVRKGAVLINCARGGLIESNQLLADALDKKLLSAVGLDVLENEPPAPGDPLLNHPGAILTAHVGSRTPRTQRLMVETLLSDMRAALTGQQPNPSHVAS